MFQRIILLPFSGSQGQELFAINMRTDTLEREGNWGPHAQNATI
jgi:hypothetical protein